MSLFQEWGFFFTDLRPSSLEASTDGGGSATEGEVISSNFPTHSTRA